jgi:hypothetical protein
VHIGIDVHFGPEWKFAGSGDAGYGLGRRLIEGFAVE